MANTTAVIVIFGTGVPEAPINLVASCGVLDNSIDLTWEDTSDNENSFKIYKSTDGYTFSFVNSVDTGITAYSVTNINDEQQYWFQVTAYNTAGESAYAQTTSIVCSWIQITTFNFGYWPKSYWTSYWFLKYWQIWGILGAKFINKMRRISRNRKEL